MRPIQRHLLAACLLFLPPAAAEPLAAFHWVGADAAAAAGYEGSPTQELVGLMNPADLAEAAGRVTDALLLRYDDPDLRDGVRMVERLGGVSLAYPLTAWVEATDAGAGPGFAGAVEWTVPDATARGRLAADLATLLRQAGSPEGVAVTTDGDAVRVASGQPGPAPAQPDGPPAVVSLTADVAALVGIGEAALRENAPEDVLGPTQAVLAVLNPGGIERLSLRQGFNDAGLWLTTLEVDAPAPRTGLAALLVDAPALTDDDLSAVPADAPVVAAFGFDVAAAWALAREAVAAADAAAADQLDGALVQARDATGVDVEADLIDAFGGGHVLFQDPAVAGDSLLGLVAVNRLRDPERFEAGVATLLELANGLVEAQTVDLPVSGRAFVTDRNGVAVTTIPLPGIAPSLAVVDGTLVIGLYPQTLIALLDRRAGAAGGEPAPSILSVPAFADALAAGRDRSGGSGVTSVSFVDLPRLAPQAYGSLLVLEHVGTGLASMAAREPVPAVLPPFARIRPLLSPATGVGFATPAGGVSESVGPFPGSSMLGQGGGGGVNALFTIPSMVPAFQQLLGGNPYNGGPDGEPFPPFPDEFPDDFPDAPPPPAPGSVPPPPPPPSPFG